jgi:hypothetical protein
MDCLPTVVIATTSNSGLDNARANASAFVPLSIEKHNNLYALRLGHFLTHSPAPNYRKVSEISDVV